jgi:iron complex outermembrane receptor protein
MPILLITSAALAAAATGPDLIPASAQTIVVTAQRRAEDIQAVPLSVSAVGGQTIETLGLRDPRDLALIVPGVTYQSAFSTSAAAIFIRGVGSSDFNAATTGAVGVYRDDVFVNANSSKLADLFDLDRAEVLKGPQGTLYGRNTTGGAIKLVSRMPTDTISADLTASYGRFKERIVDGGVGGPLIAGTLKVRVAGLFEKREGTTLNRVTGHRVNDLDLWGLRGIADLTPTEDILLRAIVHGGHNHSGGREFQSRGSGADLFGNPSFLADGTPADAFGYADADHDVDAGDYDVEGRDRVDTFGASLNARANLGAVELSSITAWEKTDHTLLEDTDATPNNVVTGYYDDHARQFSQEVRLGSADGSRLRWTLGGYYLTETLRNNGAFDVLRITRDPTLPLDGFDPSIGNGFQRYPSVQHTRSLAAFGQADYALTDRLTATGGLRYSNDRLGLRYRSFFDEPSGIYPLIDVDDRRTFHDLSWRGALSWKAGATLAYASASKGYNSGGFPSGLANFPEQIRPYKSERLYAYEAGIKTGLAGGRVTVNTAAYYYDYRDIQVFVFDTSGTIPLQRKINAGDARIYGLEAGATARPAARLEASITLNLLHGEYRHFTTLSAVDYSGNRIVNAPRVSLNGGLAYSLPIAGGEVTGRVDAAYQSTMFLNPENSDTYRVRAYAMVNARLAFRLPGNTLEIAVFARNLTDSRAIAYVSPIITQFEVNYTDPRTYGVQLVARFR